MFRSARLKLTITYLIIIMLISGFFSLVIYKGFTFVLDNRLNHLERGLPPSGFEPPSRMKFLHRGIDSSVVKVHIEFAKGKALLFLLYANGFILIIFAGAGYFFAGKSLKPIERSLEEQNRFVADASHEFRTPLTALKTSIEVALRDKEMSVKNARKILKSNLEDVDHLEVLASDMLSLAQYQKSNSNFVITKISLDEIVKNAYKKVDALARAKEIKLNKNVQDIVLEVDKQSFEKAIVILLDNAIKYTAKGGKVDLTAKQDRKHLLLEVKDNGIGITDKDIEHVFDRFYRVDQSRSKAKVEGYGLGLAMLKQIVEQHKGSVEVASSVGTGSSFTIKIPNQ